jgi:predicted RNA binding protein YcfA (HicA-like mRNA interferase family)
MKAADILRRIKDVGGAVVRQRGSHVRVTCRCGKNFSTVPDQGSHDVPIGTLRAVERDLAPCFGKRWLR